MSGFGSTGGFGSSQNPFGLGQQPPAAPPAPQQPPMFGSSPFGNQNTVAPSQALASNFGPPVNSSSHPFGSPQTVQQQPFLPSTNPFGTTTTAATATPPVHGHPFSNASTTSGQFVQQAVSNTEQPSNPFGTASANVPSFGVPGQMPGNTVPNNHPFGATPQDGMTTFPHVPQQQQSMNSVPNPFSASNTTMFAPAAPMMSFGVSANVADDSEMVGGSHAQVQPGTTWNNTFNNNNMNNNNNSLLSPSFPQPEMDMGNREKPPPRSDLPFGTPVDTKRNNNATEANASTWNSSAANSVPNPFIPVGVATVSSGLSGSVSPVMADAPSSFPSDDNTTTDKMSSTNAESARLAKLKAKIEEKKRLLEGKKKHEAQQQNTNRQPKSNDTVEHPEPVVDPNSDLANRNALRFATNAVNQDTKALLPADLQDEAPTDYAALRQTHMDTQDLGSATSLVGKCLHMCPSEELLRRQREGDIQLLEIPTPGDLHPQGWTLRETAVKRFRRSAADYKLDVPEWVRPPHVLERVCAYLEEWVMERDRQGSDFRFQSGTPPSLDVYQFIWDRTRMVRKDFILQNYVGTGGNCSARAVRCHERIARWHAMCEHQLSHIDDFVTMQSQQNIQELGQTMKTLNQYYDDVLHRSTIEEPDSNGRETWKRNPDDKYVHGCEVNVVQGNDPVDFDGTPLKNRADNQTSVAKRAIGRPNFHGTAEQEMSGLYILLTIENDGGMEVMRYVSHLSRVRPHVHKSRLVQLALSVFKAKKEYNYARFFQILRSPSTPYLFACIMFKHVGSMRRVAFQIMSKTYGGKSKETNEAIYDAYPLKDLVTLLCFEDEQEARAACKHFNIAVNSVKVRSGSAEDIVFWRHSSFREPKDESKGTVVSLRPWKMLRTIESKLDGATRLAVCRGEKSGGDAFVNEHKVGQPVEETQSAIMLFEKEAAEAREKKRKEDAMKHELELERIKKEEKLRRQQEEREREIKRLVEQQKEERRQKEEREKLRLRRIEELRRQEAARQLEKERQEAERKKREEEQRKREAEVARRKREEEQELMRQKALEEERRRIAEERERLAKVRQLELERQRQELERQKQEREHRELQERMEAEKWNRAISSAREKLSFRRWLHKYPTHLRLQDNRISSQSTPLGEVILPVEKHLSPQAARSGETRGLRGILEVLLREGQSGAIRASDIFHGHVSLGWTGPWRCCLYKIAVVFPVTDTSYLNLLALTQTWIAQSLRFGSPSVTKSSACETRVVFIDGNKPHVVDSCDAILIVLPCTQEVPLRESVKYIDLPTKCDIPRVALVLNDCMGEPFDTASSFVESVLSDSSNEMYVLANDSLKEDSVRDCLSTSIEYLAEVIGRPKCIERLSCERLVTRCITTTLWTGDFHTRNSVVKAAREALFELYQEITSPLEENNWPGSEFCDNGPSSVVYGYFGNDGHLPLGWANVNKSCEVRSELRMWIGRMDGTLREVLCRLLVGIPEDIQEECRILESKHLYRRCLELALLSKCEAAEPWHDQLFVYFPTAFLDDLLYHLSKKVTEKSSQTLISEPLEDTEKVVPVLSRLKELLGTSPKRSLDLAEAPTAPREVVDQAEDIDSMQAKRRRLETSQKKSSERSVELRESMAFTERLQGLVSGVMFQDRMIGSKPLSALMNKTSKN